MGLDVPGVQEALRQEGLDGWLLYDFHGSNPIAASLAGLAGSAKMTTRRWYYLVPADGAPRALVHAIERHNLDHLPGEKIVYAGREQLDAGLERLLNGQRRVAMEYSPGGAIPYLSRIDAGTIERIRQNGVDVVSSGDLVQRFQAVWNAEALAMHREASEKLYRVKDRAFGAIGERARTGTATTEFEVQSLMVGWFAEEGLVSDSAPVVAAQEHAGDPHYLPTPERHRPIRRDELILLDLWGKLARPGAVYADITWVGFVGAAVPERMAVAFDAVRRARDAASAFVIDAAAARREVRGFEVDRAARRELEASGHGAYILHRTGHSLGEDVHGNGVHMDDYETHDDRRLLPGTGFTIEPGLYFDDFGVRTEINMYFGDGRAEVTGPAQERIVTLLN